MTALAGVNAMQEDTDDGLFPLDRVENPHEVLVRRAVMFRRAARASTDPVIKGFWLGYLDAMCSAGTWTSEAMNAYIDRHDTVDTAAIVDARNATPVGISRRLGGPKDRAT